jgi:RimJ/RimL family protein N-acetyltransferase
VGGGAVSVILRTPRTTLEPLTPDHTDTMHALWTDRWVRQYLWDGKLITRERAAEVIAASQADFAAHRYGLWAVVDNATRRVIGFCGLRSGDHDAPELLYGLCPRFWGKGLATEAARAVLSYAFALGHPEVVAATDLPNDASARVLERLGMKLERRGLLNGLDTLFFRKSYEDHARRED